MIAHQKKIREQRALENCDADLLGDWWNAIDGDISRARVCEISSITAASIIEKYEWLGTMPAIPLHSFGIFFGDVCGGAVVYAPEYIENLGNWDRYGYTGKIILLARGACAHWAHEHAASKLIRRSMRLLPKRYEVVTATVDAAAGEIGTIYQACGFHYVGVMSQGGRATITLADGSVKQSRSARRLKLKLPKQQVARKARYFGFRSNGKRHLAAIEHLVLPYPKRVVSI